MSNFKSREKNQVTQDSTASYTFYDGFEIVVRPATMHNKPYQNFAKRYAAVIEKKGKNVGENDLEPLIDAFADHIVVRFGDKVVTDSGKKPENTAAVFREFLKSCDPLEFSELVGFCTDYRNFMPDAITGDDIEGIVGNSKSV